MRGFEWILAWRYVTDRKGGYVSLISIFSFIGIVLGIATLIVVTSVMNGFRIEMFDKILGFTGHVHLEAREGLESYQDLTERLRAEPEVDLVIAGIEGQGLLSSQGRSTGVSIKGISSADLQSVDFLVDSLQVVIAPLSEFTGEAGVLIGDSLSRQLDLRPGSSVTLLTPQGQYSPFGFLPKAVSYRVFGIFDTGQYQYDSLYVLLPLSGAQSLVNMPNKINNIQIELKDPQQAQAFVDRLGPSLPPATRLSSWQRTHASLYQALQTERNVMVLILSLIILVAAMNIISGQVMLIKDKSKVIAILNAMGATRATILRIFFLSGSMIGVSGTAFGFILGLSLSRNVDIIREMLLRLANVRVFQEEIYFLSRLPSHIKWFDVSLIVTAGLCLSMLAALYPAWRASRLEPAVLLRNQ